MAGDFLTWDVPLGDADTLELTWEDEDGTPIDLTGWTPHLFDVAPQLQGALAATIPAPAAGTIEVRLRARPALQPGARLRFRLALQPPAPATADDRQAFDPFVVVVR